MLATAQFPPALLVLTMGPPREIWILAVALAVLAATHLPLPLTGHKLGENTSVATLDVSTTSLSQKGLLGFCTLETMVGTPSASSYSQAKEKAWLNSQTRGNVVKTIGALRLHILKQTANSAIQCLGAGSKILCVTFVLRKFPEQRNALQVALPDGAMRSTEGLFLKTSTGRRTLSVEFGRGDSKEVALVANVQAILKAVFKKLDVKLVREIFVGVDRLMLPIWNYQLWDRGKKNKTAWLTQRCFKRTSMHPPDEVPRKRPRTL